ncbi:MAG: glycosyltransferase [Bacteroidia bacterium]|jgi:glycosyltransferase involved in cell wall biosynthesis|nr:glycosyltransferase [Bacteroidia bacterium]NBY10452.1 glycosyltransferase [Sphingobacteriia bacterium]
MSVNETGNVLYITEFWPDPTQSAAGRRQVQILRILESAGYNVTTASTAHWNENQNTTTFTKQRLQLFLNTEQTVSDLIHHNPKLVIFDRFLQEEKWGWIFDQFLPTCIKITDTSDFYSLRNSREHSITSHTVWNIDSMLEDPVLLRELASIYKCDLNLVISSVEYKLLTQDFKVHPDLILHLPFRILNAEPLAENQRLYWKDRKHIVFIGQYKHAPNRDCIEFIQSNLWPEIMQRIPGIEMHIYGAGFPQAYISKFNAVYTSLQIRGVCNHLHPILNTYRIVFAPLRFGAGQKGKFIDAMCAGTPIITSAIGAEGMWTAHEIPDSIAQNDTDLITLLERVYNNEKKWKQSQTLFNQVALHLQSNAFENTFVNTLQTLLHTLKSHRHTHILGRILKTEAYAAQRYKYRYIEEKNKKIGGTPPKF